MSRFFSHTKFGLLLAVGLCSGGALDAVASLVVNGDFEDPVVTELIAWHNYATGESFPGWTVDSGSIDVVRMRDDSAGEKWSAASGSQSVDLNGFAPGSIYQDLNTLPGGTYYLSFALAGNVIGGQLIVRMDFSWAGSVVDTLTFDVGNHDGYDVGWTYHQYAVQAPADATVTRLRFASLSNTGARGPALDDVVIGETPREGIPIEDFVAVPEPSTWLAGAGALIALLGNLPGALRRGNSTSRNGTPAPQQE